MTSALLQGIAQRGWGRYVGRFYPHRQGYFGGRFPWHRPEKPSLPRGKDAYIRAAELLLATTNADLIRLPASMASKGHISQTSIPPACARVLIMTLPDEKITIEHVLGGTSVTYTLD